MASDFRPLYRAMFDDPTFLGLTANARLVLLTLKALLGTLGLARVPSLEGQLEEYTGLPRPRVKAALAELVASGWIAMEGGTIHLMRWGFSKEPLVKPGNPKHVAFAQRLLADVPEGVLKTRFVELHPAWFPASESHADSLSDSLCDSRTALIQDYPIPSQPNPIPSHPGNGADAPAGVAELQKVLQRVGPCSAERAEKIAAELRPVLGDSLVSAAEEWARDLLRKPPQDLRFLGKDPFASFVSRAGYWLERAESSADLSDPDALLQQLKAEAKAKWPLKGRDTGEALSRQAEGST